MTPCRPLPFAVLALCAVALSPAPPVWAAQKPTPPFPVAAAPQRPPIDRAKFDAVYRAGQAVLAGSDSDATVREFSQLVRAFKTEVVIAQDLASSPQEKDLVSGFASAHATYEGFTSSKDAAERDLANARLKQANNTLLGRDNTQSALDVAALETVVADHVARMKPYRDGIELFNKSQWEDARVAFEKARALNPGLADASYFLAMSFVGQGKLPEAKAPLLDYLKLAPDGSHADEARQMLAVIR